MPSQRHACLDALTTPAMSRCFCLPQLPQRLDKATNTVIDRCLDDDHDAAWITPLEISSFAMSANEVSMGRKLMPSSR
jgi:hypothetical protein